MKLIQRAWDSKTSKIIDSNSSLNAGEDEIDPKLLKLNPLTLLQCSNNGGDPELEAGAGIEPANRGFADLCLTTWLPRHSLVRWHREGNKCPRSGKVATELCGKNRDATHSADLPPRTTSARKRMEGRLSRRPPGGTVGHHVGFFQALGGVALRNGRCVLPFTRSIRTRRRTRKSALHGAAAPPFATPPRLREAIFPRS